jgi:hypothetical protein
MGTYLLVESIIKLVTAEYPTIKRKSRCVGTVG